MTSPIPTRPEIYDFDQCDEMTLCALAVLGDARDRLAAAGLTDAVAYIDRLTAETVADNREDDDDDER